MILDSCIVFGKVFLYSNGEAYFFKDMGIGVHSCTCVAKYSRLALAKYSCLVLVKYSCLVLVKYSCLVMVKYSCLVMVKLVRFEGRQRLPPPPPPWSAPRLADVFVFFFRRLGGSNFLKFLKIS